MNSTLIERIDQEIQNLMGQRDVIQRLLPNNTAVRELTQIIKVLLDCKAALSQEAQPVASVTGYVGGNCVIEPIDRTRVMPVGMALYSQLVASSQDAEGLTPKAAWWAGYRAGKGLPEDTPRKDAIGMSAPQDVEEFIDSKSITSDKDWPQLDVVRVPVDVLETILEVVRGKLNEAYQNAMPVCCGQPGQECCGNPVAEWNPSDIELMDSLGLVEKTISAMLAVSKERTE